MRSLELFAGIGGIALAEQMAGIEVAGLCEYADYPRMILKKHWPDVPLFKDVTKLDREELTNAGIEPGSIDIVSGGFPCQPFSIAGKRRGTKDDRDLWPEMFRIIKQIWPTWVVGEMLLTSQIWNSTERFLTWKARDTKHGHLYYQLVPSMPRTSGSEHSLWPTPTASDTFTANLKSSQQRIGSRHSVTLPQVVRMFWLTPTATDGKRASQFSSKSLAKGKVNGNLAQQVAHQQNGSLNPAWVEWLMGYPIGWTE